jgi:hypothetical protein
MRRLELIALRSAALRWSQLTEALPRTLETLGLVHDEAATDGEITVLDHGEEGCVLLLDDCALARRAALSLATRSQAAVDVFEVIATSGGKHHRFRTAAFKATAKGELKDAEGEELDLEDHEQTWGGGDLAQQARRVLDLFARLDFGATRTLQMGFRRRPKGRPSTPRVATLLASLQKARSHEVHPLPDGRVELRVELAAGGKQTSFCTKAEHEELERLLGK